MADWLNSFENTWVPNLIATIALLGAAIGIRAAAVRFLVHREKLSRDRRRGRLISIRRLVLLVTVVGVLTIWAKELRPFALSLFAVAVAVVIATKEMLQSLTGGLVNASSQIYSIGDRIEIKGIRGDVIDKNLLRTKILELGPGTNSHQYTGRTISVPNSLLLENAVHSESLTGEFVIHVVTIPLSRGDDWKRAEALLAGIARAECASFFPEAQKQLDELETREWIEVPSAEPRVTIKLGDPNTVTLLLRIPSPARRQRAVEQRIVSQFLTSFYPIEAQPANQVAEKTKS